MPANKKYTIIRNGTLIDGSGAQPVANEALVIRDGRIHSVGSLPEELVLENREDIQIIDAAGMTVMPGLIDAHSHSALSSVNEGTQSITSEVRIKDVIDPYDIAIYRELAGGLTSANLLHGSANAIGGQNAVIKLRWGSIAKDMIIKDAIEGIKFALGENVKQSNWGDDYDYRYPQTRMGVDQIIRDGFNALVEKHCTTKTQTK